MLNTLFEWLHPLILTYPTPLMLVIQSRSWFRRKTNITIAFHECSLGDFLMDGSSESSFGGSPGSPRSPPASLNLYGKRTQMFKVQALEREIGLLQEELKSVEGLQPASRYCKEVDDFVGAKQDPLVTKTQKIHKSHTSWKHQWQRSCRFPLVCCCFSCTFHLKMPSFFTCCISCKSECLHCSCCSENTTCLKCCNCEGHSCSTCPCCCFAPGFNKLEEVNSGCGCRKASYSSSCQ